MVILLLPYNDNETLAKEIASLLESFGGVICITENSVLEYADLNPEFLLVNTKAPSTLHAETLLYLETNDTHIEISNVLNLTKTISTCSYKNAAEHTITIGSNTQCTLSISSNEENKLSIALQDTMTTLNGSQIYPCEIALKHENRYSTTALLFFTAILLLCGKVNTDTLEIQIK